MANLEFFFRKIGSSKMQFSLFNANVFARPKKKKESIVSSKKLLGSRDDKSFPVKTPKTENIIF